MKSRKKIYLDHNATTPVDPRVLKMMLPYFTEIFGNAGSIDHDFGHEAKLAVDKAREQLAQVIKCLPDEIIFTSGATESNNIALFGIAEKYSHKGDHIITSRTEHKAILDVCSRLEKMGKRVTYLPVDNNGLVDIDALEKAITNKTILISIMAANNEIGTLGPLVEIGTIARKYEVLFHTDASQAFGQIEIDVQKCNIDILSISAHKIYGPKGVGALYRRRSNPRVNLVPVIYGGGHEKGIRSGTLNVPGIVGLGEAAVLAKKEMAAAANQYRKWNAFLFETLSESFEGVKLNGDPQHRLPNNLSLSISGLESRALIVALKDIAISTGSACTSNSVEPSHVIRALGFEEHRAHSTIRIGVGRFNSDEQIRIAADKLVDSIRNLLEIKV